MGYFTYAKNRPSPPNEDDYKRAYKKLVPSASNKDDRDISCVVSMSGINGHGLMDYSDNRSKDRDLHACYYFVEDTILRQYM